MDYVLWAFEAIVSLRFRGTRAPTHVVSAPYSYTLQVCASNDTSTSSLSLNSSTDSTHTGISDIANLDDTCDTLDCRQVSASAASPAAQVCMFLRNAPRVCVIFYTAEDGNHKLQQLSDTFSAVQKQEARFDLVVCARYSTPHPLARAAREHSVMSLPYIAGDAVGALALYNTPAIHLDYSERGAAYCKNSVLYYLRTRFSDNEDVMICTTDHRTVPDTAWSRQLALAVAREPACVHLGLNAIAHEGIWQRAMHRRYTRAPSPLSLESTNTAMTTSNMACHLHIIPKFMWWNPLIAHHGYDDIEFSDRLVLAGIRMRSCYDAIAHHMYPTTFLETFRYITQYVEAQHIAHTHMYD